MHIKRGMFEHIYWLKLKVNIHLCFHSNRILIGSIVSLTANEAEQHIFLSNHKISTFLKKKKNYTPSFEE